MEDMVMASDFWRGRRVLITGHTGFKGSWLTLWLRALGAEVAGYALDTARDPSLWKALNLADEIANVRDDIRNFDELARTFAKNQPEIVFHLAAQSLVHPSYRDPVGTYSTNVMGTVHLLEAVRMAPSVRAVIVVTSDKCYENREWIWGYRESDAMGGLDPYSSSKGCAELVTAAYRNSFFGDAGAAIISARAGNVIGGGDWADDRLVPDFVRAVSRGLPVEIRNPTFTRPWQHVLEPLRGYLMLAQRGAEAGSPYIGAWNFGPTDEGVVPVAALVSELVSLWGKSARWIGGTEVQAHEAHFLKLDSSKARALLGWKPRLDLKTTLAWTVEWYQRWAQGVPARELCIEQIRRYEEMEN